mgnify:CR=1 FL=1
MLADRAGGNRPAISQSNAGCKSPGAVCKCLAEFRNPVAIVTENFLVTRDVDHFWPISLACSSREGQLSITTLNARSRPPAGTAGVASAP